MAGITGITTGAAAAVSQARSKLSMLLDWRVGFLIGLIGGGLWVAQTLGVTSGLAPRSPGLLLVAGLLWATAPYAAVAVHPGTACAAWADALRALWWRLRCSWLWPWSRSP